MPLSARVTVWPDTLEGFGPDAFHDLLQRQIELPGLDPAYRHQLVDVDVAEDGSSADLTVWSEPVPGLVLDPAFRLVTAVPPARVRVQHEDGRVLHAGPLSAPLRDGQLIELGGFRYLVTTTEHPHRDPETGVCRGLVDWQHATVAAAPEPSMHPTASTP